jgi:hypothetical protein
MHVELEWRMNSKENASSVEVTSRKFEISSRKSKLECLELAITER